MEDLDELFDHDSIVGSTVTYRSSTEDNVAPDDSASNHQAGTQPAAAQRYHRAYRHCFTVWSQTDDVEAMRKCIDMDNAEWLKKYFKYIVYQVELSTSTRRPHAQGYCHTVSQMTTNQLKKLFSIDEFRRTVHISSARKDAQVNTKYCTKLVNEEDQSIARLPGTEPVIWGEPPTYGSAKEASETKPFDQIVAAIHKGKKLNDLEWNDPDFAHCHSTIARYRNHFVQTEAAYATNNPDTSRRVFVEFLIGLPGRGKTYDVQKNRWKASDIYTTTAMQKKWFDGYTGQPVLHIDDFSKQFDPDELKILCDCGINTKIEIKGAVVLAKWVHVCLCSNLQPEHWWRPTREMTQEDIDLHVAAIRSRVHFWNDAFKSGRDRRKDADNIPQPYARNL